MGIARSRILCLSAQPPQAATWQRSTMSSRIEPSMQRGVHRLPAGAARLFLMKAVVREWADIDHISRPRLTGPERRRGPVTA